MYETATLFTACTARTNTRRKLRLFDLKGNKLSLVLPLTAQYAVVRNEIGVDGLEAGLPEQHGNLCAVIAAVVNQVYHDHLYIGDVRIAHVVVIGKVAVKVVGRRYKVVPP